jgi:hypothetical protein
VPAVIAAEVLLTTPQPLEPSLARWLEQWSAHVFVRLALYLGLLATCGATRLPRRAALALGLVFDLALYQFAVYVLRVPAFRQSAVLVATAARPPLYQPERRVLPVEPGRPETDDAANRLSALALELARQSGSHDLYWYVYQFAQFDPCRGEWRTDYYQASVARLLELGRTRGAEIDRLLGCYTPKLEVVSEARTARSPSEARDLVRAAALAARQLPTVIQLDPGSDVPPSGRASPTPANRVEVRRFTLAELEAEVQVDAPSGAWLVYRDAFHAGWRAEVNGAETKLHVADLAWKAVRVPPGASHVRFWFRNGANHALAGAIALFGLAVGAGFVGWMAASLLPRRSRVVRGGYSGSA